MKVLIEYNETGLYRDNSWAMPSIRIKGQRQAVEPALAATLIKTHKASLHKNESGELIIHK